MRKSVFSFSITAFCLVFYSAIYAQWTLTNGPIGGHTTSIVSLSSNLYAGDNGGGVFVSADNGNTWTASNSGLTNLNITSIVVNGTDLFVGTYNGLFRSHDNGATWSKVATAPGTVLSLINNQGVLYAASAGVYTSTDGGSTWTSISNGISNKIIQCLAVSGTNLIAGSDDGIYVSTNNGASWTKAYSSTIDGIVKLTASGSTVYAGGSNGRFFRSTDSGLTWTLLSHNFQISIRSIFILNSFIYVGTAGGGIQLSIDNAVTWNFSAYGLTNFGVGAIILVGNTMYAGTDGSGVFSSTDYGATWVSKNSGMNVAYTSALGVFNNQLVAGSWGSQSAVSPDNGATWTIIPNLSSPGLATAIFQVNSTLLMGTVNGLWRSIDNGTSWQISNPDLYFNAFALSGSNLFAATTTGGVMLSTDEGASWTTVNNGLTNLSVSSLLVSGSNLFAGTKGGGIFISSNNGSTWSPTNSGLLSTQITALALSGNSIFAGTDGRGVFVSNDNGLSWTAEDLGLSTPDVISLVVSGNKIFASTYNGIYLSNPKNIYWSQEGLANIAINSLLAFHGNVYASTYSGIYYQSLNNFPEINSITPSEGAVGTTVTISGSNFSSTIAKDTVMFNGVKAVITNASATSLTVVVPATATTGPVRMAVGTQSIISGADFTIHLLASPTATDATNISDTGFTANWNTVSGATGYQLDVSTDNFQTFVTNYNSATETGTSQMITGLTKATTYQYRVRAANASGSSGNSNIISVITNKSDQTITFGSLTSVDYGTAPITLGATASSGLTVSYASSNTAVATITGNTLTITGAGSTTITATQAGNNYFNAAMGVDQILTVNQASQTIIFNTLDPISYRVTPLILTGSTSSGLAITYSSANTSVATVHGDSVTIKGIGTTTITASQPGNTNYTAASAVQQTLTVNQASQTITFSSLPTVPNDQAPFRLNKYASSSSGLALTYSSSDPTVATISGDTITIIAIGSTTITASQGGNANYTAATSVDQLLKVEQPQTITFNAIDAVLVTHVPIDLNTYATASSGLALNYSSSNTAVATITANILTIVGAGTTTITAYQAGDATYAPASSKQQTLNVYSKILSLSGASLAADTLAFGKVDIGLSSTLKFTITNTGNDSLIISKISYPIGFSGDQSKATIKAGGTLDVNVVFTPFTLNKVTDVIVFSSDAISGPGQLFVTGTGDKITGVEASPPSFSAYPNPSTGLITLQGIDKSVNEEPSIQIVDTMGRTIENFKISILEPDKYLLDITALNNGLYLIHIPNKATVRIIKK